MNVSVLLFSELVPSLSHNSDVFHFFKFRLKIYENLVLVDMMHIFLLTIS
jgi:hypothetical protein